MDQAYEFEVAGSREIYGIHRPTRQSAGVHARCIGFARSVRRCPWAPHLKRRSHLVGPQEGDGMNLVRTKGPRHALANMNPKLIRQKGQSLVSFIGTLGTRVSLNLG